jgi:hypothetical protein
MRAAVAQMDAAPPAEKRRGGRPALSDDHWREFARRCIDINRQGKGAVLRTLAEGSGKSERTIANWIQTARNERCSTDHYPPALSACQELQIRGQAGDSVRAYAGSTGTE